ncbi:cytochrome b5 domain-containing protein [Heterostelium album PN500]|uniref:Cytochrome b5 domain-containing protein n=1 Tax=Heterostelium pallidum (strain ATCC 26659 / Pp 5 / PN500) TaxID=670386 RepID=D3BEI6_HETP5|nr:cytochrome b5 domain-containing protein [Heterostelium album PN500]EFA80317.1 cytochrome b5 domain-containing protein [Heterostelium album PN500]|eukprot:XP_020432437.1 cytochrome b5 domain-containing protein [Heterostelium album PN500]
MEYPEVIPTEFEIEEKASGKRQKQKVPLQHGHSQLDWMRLQKQPAVATAGTTTTASVATKHKFRSNAPITIEELKQHSTPEDAWTVYKGRVYDITPYFTYHPGGDAQLARAAGKDCTRMFEFRHGWVNFEAMMEKLCIGYIEQPK